MFWKIIIKNILNNKLLAFITIFVLTFVMFFSIFLNFVYKNITTNIVSSSIGKQENKFFITRKNESFFKKLLYKRQTIGSVYQKLKQDKNIKQIYANYIFKMPVQADINFLNSIFNTDILIFASTQINNTWNNIKLWINPTMLNLYNSQIAWWYLPKIDANLLKWIHINLIFGKNSFLSFKNTKKYNATISSLSSDYPIIWLTMSYKKAKQIIKKLWWWELKMIKIIWIAKNKAELFQIEKKYKNFNIETTDKLKRQTENKLKVVQDVFNILRYFIFALMWSFLLSLAINIYNNSKSTLKVFYYHGASFLQQFKLLLWEISIYMMVSIFLNLLIIFFINNTLIEKINFLIKKQWLVNISLNFISYIDLLTISLWIYLFIILIFWLVFSKEKRI